MTILIFFVNIGCFITDKLNITPLVYIKSKSYEFENQDYISALVSSLTLIITAFLSYSLLQTSKKSNALFERSEKKEEKKEKDNIKENVLVIFYELLFNLRIIRSMYEEKLINNNEFSTKINISEDWVKSISKMKNMLSNQDINKIADIYYSLSDLKISNENEDLKIFAKKFFDKNYLEYVVNRDSKKSLLGSYIDDIESILNIETQLLFEKMRRVIIMYASKDMNNIVKIDQNRYEIKDDNNYIWYIGELNNNNLDGKGTIYNLNGKERYTGEFKENSFIEGTRFEYYTNGEVYINMEYKNQQRVEGIIFKNSLIFDKDNLVKNEESNENMLLYSKGKYRDDKFCEGFLEEYEKNGFLKYKGEKLDFKYHGRGILYRKNEEIQGCFVENSAKIGIFEKELFKEGYETNVIYDVNGDHCYEFEKASEQSSFEDQEALEENFENIKKEEVISGGSKVQFINIYWENFEEFEDLENKRIVYYSEGYSVENNTLIVL